MDDLDGTEQPYNPARGMAAFFVPFLLPLGERFPGAGAVAPAGLGVMRGRAEPTPCRSSGKNFFEEIRQFTTCEIIS